MIYTQWLHQSIIEWMFCCLYIKLHNRRHQNIIATLRFRLRIYYVTEFRPRSCNLHWLIPCPRENLGQQNLRWSRPKLYHWPLLLSVFCNVDNLHSSETWGNEWITVYCMSREVSYCGLLVGCLSGEILQNSISFQSAWMKKQVLIVWISDSDWWYRNKFDSSLPQLY